MTTDNSFAYKILMLGESLGSFGGVVELQKHILNEMPPEFFLVKQVPTTASGREGPLLPKIVIYAKALVTTFIALARNDCDLLHLHITERGSILRKMLLALLAWLFRRPYIIHTHGAEFHLFYEALPDFLKKPIKLFFAKSTFVLVLSNTWQAYFVDKFQMPLGKVKLLYNPVKVHETIPNKEENKQNILIFSLGKIGARKGSFDLIKAFHLLPNQFKQCSNLLLAGDGDLELAQALINDLNLEDQVKLLKWLDKPQVYDYLSQTDIFALPSYNEGLPLALLEAMSWETAIVTTPVGGIPDVISDQVNGILIPPGDIKRLSEALLKLITESKFRIALGKQARKDSLVFDVSSYCENLEKIYHAALINKESNILAKDIIKDSYSSD